MSPETGTSTSHEWHETLRDNDLAVRAVEDERSRREGDSRLEDRLVAASAELTALRAAVSLRDRLLQEQQLALAERDRRIDELVALTAHARRRPLHRRVLGRLRRTAGRLRARLR